MNISRTKTVTTIEASTVDSVTEATEVMKAILNGSVKPRAQQDAANGAVEAYFVTYLRTVHQDRLEQTVKDLQKTFGTFQPFRRALKRVKAFRGKNPAWRNITI